jgi:hypothetical protein
MTIQRLISCCALLTIPTAFAAEPLGIKPGAWEMSYTSQISGETMPQSMLDKLTPEQRAKHEERMKKRAADGPRKRTDRTCVKKEDLARDAFGKEGQKDCQYKISSQTKSLYAATYECTGAGARKGEIRYEVLGSEKIKGSMKMTTARGAMDMQLEGRWLGAVCSKDDD